MHVPVVQLVWDTDRSGLGSLDGEGDVRVDPASAWGPSSLLALSASSALMAGFLDLADAAALRVLGYVSAAYLERPGPASSRALVRLVPCVTVASDGDVALTELLLQTAAASSSVVQCLGEHLVIESDVRVLPLGEDACAV